MLHMHMERDAMVECTLTKNSDQSVNVSCTVVILDVLYYL